MYNKYEKCQPSGIDVILTRLFYGDAFKFHKLATADGHESIFLVTEWLTGSMTKTSR